MQTHWGNTIIIGKITIEAYAFDEENVSKVEFYVDDVKQYAYTNPPFEWIWDETIFWKHTIKVKAYYKDGVTPTEEIDVMIFNI
jgi:hypothetical protein